MNEMIGRLFRVVLAFAAVALLLTAHHLNAQAQGPDCNSLVANNSYGMAFQGFLNVPMYSKANNLASPPEGIGIVPSAGAGYMTLLPNGNVGGRLTMVIGMQGVFQDLRVDESQSHYSLALDASRKPAVCAGTLIAATPESVAHFQLMVSPDGQRIELIHTDAGLAVSVTGFRMVASGCGPNTVSGKYLYNMRGWGLGGIFGVEPSQLMAGWLPFAFSGAMQFGPAAFPRLNDPGSVESWDTITENGQIFPRTATGSYSVKPDCTGIVTLTDSTITYHLEMFVDRKTGTVYMVNIDTVTIPGMAAPIPPFLLGATMSPSGQ
jgi:hypothetical protein